MNTKTKPQRGAPPHHFIDTEWLDLRTEDVLDPSRPIVDAHHHLWDRPPHSLYLLPEILQDIKAGGHNIRGTIFAECTSMYRADGDPDQACLGQVEFANGIGAMSASGVYGPVRVCAGIVGKVDLTQPKAEALLTESIARAPDRFRGIRQMAAWDASPDVSTLVRPPEPDLLLNQKFREGFRALAKLNLSFDAWAYHPQLPQLISLVDAFPDTKIIVNHMGGRAGLGPYRDRKDEVFAEWARSIRQLSERDNVFMKIGGIGMRLPGFDFMDRDLPPTSEELAQAFGPAFDVCVEAFGPARCILESNFPVDKSCCSYRVMWNTFKRLSAGYSEAEKGMLFAGTAVDVYRLPRTLAEPV